MTEAVEIVCPVCESGHDVAPYVPEPGDDGDYICGNPNCRAKFLWPPPPPPKEPSISPEAAAALQLLIDEGVIPNG